MIETIILPKHRTTAVLDAVCEKFQISKTELTGPRIANAFVEPRAVAAKEIRRLGKSLAQIGSVLNRDHATVGYYLSKAETFGYTPSAAWKKFIKAYRNAPKGRSNPVWDSEKTAELARLHIAGWTHDEIAKALNVSKPSVSTKMYALKWTDDGKTRGNNICREQRANNVFRNSPASLISDIKKFKPSVGYFDAEVSA